MRLQGVAPGEAELRIEQPPEFGPALDSTDILPVRVALPTVAPRFVETNFVVGKDTQLTRSFAIPAGVGGATATVVAPGSGVATFTFQALARRK